MQTAIEMNAKPLLLKSLRRPHVRAEVLAAVLVAVFFGFAIRVRACRPETSRRLTEAESVLAIYAEDWGLASDGTPKLILALWPDGRLVWSSDQMAGGPPYSGRWVPRLPWRDS